VVQADGSLKEIKAAEARDVFLKKNDSIKKVEDDNSPEKMIEGLRELKDALYDEDQYEKAFNKMMADNYNDGANPPAPVKISSKELTEKYPTAAAYLRAAKYGEDFQKRILNGENFEKVLADGEKLEEEKIKRFLEND
jgi:hypothetical protein